MCLHLLSSVSGLVPGVSGGGLPEDGSGGPLSPLVLLPGVVSGGFGPPVVAVGGGGGKVLVVAGGAAPVAVERDGAKGRQSDVLRSSKKVSLSGRSVGVLVGETIRS